MKIQELIEGKVKGMIGTKLEYPREYPLPPPVIKQENYLVLINNKKWKGFETESKAMQAATSIYNKNPRLRVSVVPK